MPCSTRPRGTGSSWGYASRVRCRLARPNPLGPERGSGFVEIGRGDPQEHPVASRSARQGCYRGHVHFRVGELLRMLCGRSDAVVAGDDERPFRTREREARRIGRLLELPRVIGDQGELGTPTSEGKSVAGEQEDAGLLQRRDHLQPLAGSPRYRGAVLFDPAYLVGHAIHLPGMYSYHNPAGGTARDG